MKNNKYIWRILTIILTAMTVGSVASADAIGYWRIEDGTSGSDIVSTADSSGNGYAATQWGLNNSAVQYSSNVGGSYVYDPVAGTYSANTGSMLASGSTNTANSMLLVDNKSAMSGSFTLEMFLKIEDGAGGAADFAGSTANRLFQLDGSASVNSIVGANSSGSSTYLTYRLGSAVTDWSNDFQDGDWHHLAYVANYNGTDTTTYSMYVDGTKLNTDISYAGEFTAENWRDFRFGLANSTMSDLDWFIDEVRLSDTALASSDFLQLVPEPATIGMVGVIGALGFFMRRRFLS